MRPPLRLHQSLISAALLVILVPSLARAIDPSAAPTTPAPAPTTTTPTPQLPDLASDPHFLDRCKRAAEYSAKNDGQGVLILLDGKVIFQEAQGGWTLDQPHPLASGTKSFSGVAAAFAIQDGLLSLDELVSDTLTEWKTDPDKSRITVRQVLSLCAGLDPMMDELKAFREGKAAGAGIVDHAAQAISLPLVAKPGEKFIYSSASYYIFGELMKRKLHAANLSDDDVVAYLQRKLFDPLKITPRFARDQAGNANLPGGCRLTAAEWSAFGEFIRHQGRAGESQLVKPDLLALLFVPSKANPNYGLTWWLLRDSDKNPEDSIIQGEIESRGEVGPIRKRIRERFKGRLQKKNQDESAGGPAKELEKLGIDQIGVMAAGLGKQRLYILPELKLTVVRFGDLRSGPGFQDREFLRLLILPND